MVYSNEGDVVTFEDKVPDRFEAGAKGPVVDGERRSGIVECRKAKDGAATLRLPRKAELNPTVIGLPIAKILEESCKRHP